MNYKDFIDIQNSNLYEVNPENLAFKSNIQDFYQKIMYISHLETKGQITSQEAYQQINFFWKQLKISNKLIKANKKNSAHEKNNSIPN